VRQSQGKVPLVNHLYLVCVQNVPLLCHHQVSVPSNIQWIRLSRSPTVMRTT
jgi:hypothetical protein